MKTVLVCILICLCLFSCTVGAKYDGLLVIDLEGNYYKLQWSVGDVYFIDELGKNPFFDPFEEAQPK